VLVLNRTDPASIAIAVDLIEFATMIESSVSAERA
jgi:hypothetical protein